MTKIKLFLDRLITTVRVLILLVEPEDKEKYGSKRHYQTFHVYRDAEGEGPGIGTKTVYSI